jgi:hypothetical protein
MTGSPCGVRRLGLPQSAHIRTGSGTCEKLRITGPNRFTAAWLMTPLEICDGFHSNPYSRQPTHENGLLKAAHENEDSTEITIISKRIADVIFYWKECAFVGQETELGLIRQNQKRYGVRCDGGATSSLSSAFLNCPGITELAVPIQAAQGGTVMMSLSEDKLCKGSNW